MEAQIERLNTREEMRHVHRALNNTNPPYDQWQRVIHSEHYTTIYKMGFDRLQTEIYWQSSAVIEREFNQISILPVLPN